MRREGGWWRRVAGLPRDVRLVCLYGFAFHAGWCAWERSVLPVWIAAHARAEVVGYVQSVQGVVAVVVAPLIGYGMDRARSARCCAPLAVGSCVCALASYAYCVRAAELGWPLYCASALWAVALTSQGILVDTALAAASSEGEERTWAFALKGTCWRAGALMGQLLNAAAFALRGDEWSEAAMRAAILSGLALCGCATGLLLLISPEPAAAQREGKAERLVKAAEPEAAGADGGGPRGRRGARSGRWCGLRALAPQWVILYAVLLRVLGKGMCMRFNPILLTERYGLSPLGLTAAVGLAQLLSIPAPLALARLASAYGRAPVMVAARLLEPLAFAALALAPSAAWATAGLVLLLGVPVGSKALERALLMDAVSAGSRARWNALESINRGTWAGSAALGSALLARSGGDFRALYLASSAVVLLSVGVLSSLVGRRPLSERPRMYA